MLEASATLPASALPLLSMENGLLPGTPLPFGFAHDRTRSRIGQGQTSFTAAKKAFASWSMFDLGWVRVANLDAAIAPGQIVAVEAHTLKLWTLNLSRITQAVDTATRFGFIYATTALHVEEGEERFLLEFDPKTGEVAYDLEAVSRPRTTLARLGLPVTRSLQHRFARESHRKLREEVARRIDLS
jgi:uncharacterized protein (UPF0548 family)